MTIRCTFTWLCPCSNNAEQDNGSSSTTSEIERSQFANVCSGARGYSRIPSLETFDEPGWANFGERSLSGWITSPDGHWCLSGSFVERKRKSKSAKLFHSQSRKLESKMFDIEFYCLLSEQQ